jgi:hypothetical protein
MMARITWTPLTEASIRDAATTNAIFDQIETQTTNLDEDNFREGGLDHVPFETDVASRKAFVPIIHSGPSDLVTPAAFATLNVGAINFQTGAITLEANERLVLRFSAQLVTSTTPTYGLPANADLNVRLRQFSNAVAAVLPGSNSTYTAGATYGIEVGVDTMGVINGPLSLDWVEVQVSEPAGLTTRWGSAVFSGHIYRRVTT